MRAALHRPHGLRPWALGAWLALLASTGAWAGDERPSAAKPLTEPTNWLQRVQQAARSSNYRGTLVFSASGIVSSARIAHYCEGEQRFESVEALDGKAHQMLRHNELVQTVWPQARVAVIERRELLPSFPGLARADDQPVDHYDVRVLGEDRVAGRDAQVVLFRPRDTLRFAQRLWSDRDSGLLLRIDTLGSKGEVLESAAFSDLSVGGKSQGRAIASAMRQLEGYKVIRHVVGATSLEAEGWKLSASVPGFQVVHCVRRPMDAVSDDPAGPHLVQAVFSDGLTHVSVFVEPFDAARHKAVRTTLGATHTTMRRQGDWWITVMGDVPMTTAQRFADALERLR